MSCSWSRSLCRLSKGAAIHLRNLICLQAVVKGNPKVSRRAKIAAGEQEKSDMTPEEQVDCLLDQATDVGILGRTWAGWRPFV